MLDFDPNKISFPNEHFIGGVLVDGEGDVLEVRRPSDGMVYAEVPIADAAIVDRAVSNAQAASRLRIGRRERPVQAPEYRGAGPS